MPPTLVLWHCIPAEDLAWRDLDGQVVVRNARSGSTHLLESLAGEVLMALVEAGAGMSVQDLVARFCADPAGEESAEWSDVIQSALSEFQRLGLAEPEAP